jgi:hypothetical protein
MKTSLFLARRLLLTGLVVMLSCCIGWAQSPKGEVKPTDPQPPLKYHGLVPGMSTAAEVRKALGQPVHEAPWYAYKLLYPAKGRPGLIDSVHLHGKEGGYACTEAASIPAGYESRDKVLAAFGEPEQEIRMATFSLLDYTHQGVRFVFDKQNQTIGVAYVPNVLTRVPEGAPRLLDLSGLREGPQQKPDKPADLGGLKAGTAQIVISPTKKEWLPPRARDSFTVHDDMYARVVVFEKDGQRIALVGADLFGMLRSDIDTLRARAKVAGIDFLMLAMSHNHAAPDTIGVYGHYPAEYVAYIQDQIYQAVTEAAGRLQPVAELRTASRELPMDGARLIGYFRNARNPGIVDPTLSLIQPIGTDGKPIATLVHFACHVEGLEAGFAELSADFPGYMCNQIHADGGGQAVFLNGAVGGMVSGDNRARTHEEAKVMGLGLAAFVKELAQTAQPPATFNYSVTTSKVTFPMTNPRFLPLYQARGGLEDGRATSEMALVRLGEAEIITLPGEVLPEVSFEILKEMKGFPRMLVGLANDQLGYIIPEYDFRSNSYEETMSQGKATAPAVRGTALKLLSGKAQ